MTLFLGFYDIWFLFFFFFFMLHQNNSREEVSLPLQDLLLFKSYSCWLLESLYLYLSTHKSNLAHATRLCLSKTTITKIPILPLPLSHCLKIHLRYYTSS